MCELLHTARRGTEIFEADQLYAASPVTAEATVRALLSDPSNQIALVAMGDNGVKRTDEDELCAIHLRNRLEGRLSDTDAIRRLIRAGGEVTRFHDPSRPHLHPEDVDIALDINRCDFAVRVKFRGWATGRSCRNANGNDVEVADPAPIVGSR